MTTKHNVSKRGRRSTSNYPRKVRERGVGKTMSPTIDPMLSDGKKASAKR